MMPPPSLPSWGGLGRFGGGPSRPSDPDSVSRLRSGTRLDWSEFRDRQGNAPDAATVMGAADLMGGNVAPAAMFGQVLAWGPNQPLVYTDPLGTVHTTMSEFYTYEAAAWLEEEGFYAGKGYTYRFDSSQGGTDASLVSSISSDAAPITYSPTSTTYPPRPRTVAAGWDNRRQVLTVVFRDGTYYNYYGVSGLEWSNFVRARSKGRYINAHLNGKMRGKAAMGAVPQEHQELLYRVARTAQVAAEGYTGKQSRKSKRGTGGKYEYGKSGTSISGGRRYRAAKMAMSRYTST